MLFREDINNQNVKQQIQSKLRGYQMNERKQILQKICSRRHQDLKEELNRLAEQEKNIQNEIKIHQNTSRTPAKYKSQVLQGLAKANFDDSFHFSYNLQKERQWIKQEKQEFECSICIQKYDENCLATLSFSCTHIFHTNCIENWFRTKDRPNCPMCRSNIEKKDNVVLQLSKRIDKINETRRKLRERQNILSNKFEEILLNRMIRMI